MKRILCLGLFVCCWATLSAQENLDSTTILSANFKFQDGVYMTFGAFQRDQPDLSWVGLEANSVINDEKQTIKIEWLKRKGQKASINLDSIWGICVNGVPYIQVDKDKNDFGAFSALRVRGKICYYEFETVVEEMVDIKAYNPLTGRPFRSAKLPRNRNVIQDMMLDFVSGRIAEFNKRNFLDWVKKDDPALWRSLKELPEKEAEEKLYKCLLIYDDRHPVFLSE